MNKIHYNIIVDANTKFRRYGDIMIGDRIKQLRKKRGMTQKELGEALGVDRSSIGKYETGTPPSSEIILKAAEYFKVSVDYLYGRDTQKLEAENDAERELLVMFRKTDGIPDEKRREITDYIGSTIDMYLKAIGADGTKNISED